MKALITGASSGIGRDMARVLAAMDIDLILVARRGDRLRELKRELAVSVDIVILDVSVKENCLALYQRFRNDSVDILINNAGFGDFGEFTQTDLDKELNMILANLAGYFIPVILEKLHVDPALASGVFVTTVTDVMGFFMFLGLATLVLPYII